MDELLREIYNRLGPNSFEGFMDFLRTMPQIILRDLKNFESEKEKSGYLTKLIIQIGSIFCSFEKGE